MRKPILVFSLPNALDKYDRNAVIKKIDETIPKEEYHRLIIFGDYKHPKVELLQKGRSHKTIKNLSKLLK